MPAKAGIQNYLETLDSRLRGNDAEGRFKTFYETINLPSFQAAYQENGRKTHCNSYKYQKSQ